MDYNIGDIVRINDNKLQYDFYHNNDMIVIGFKPNRYNAYHEYLLIVDYDFGKNVDNTIHHAHVHLVKSIRQRKLERLNGI